MQFITKKMNTDYCSELIAIPKVIAIILTFGISILTKCTR